MVPLYEVAIFTFSAVEHWAVFLIRQKFKTNTYFHFFLENLVLRIPILYGDVEYLDESAITTLFKKLLDPSQKAAEMSDYEIRRPSHVTDIASVVHDLILRCVSARTSQVKNKNF